VYESGSTRCPRLSFRICRDTFPHIDLGRGGLLYALGVVSGPKLLTADECPNWIKWRVEFCALQNNFGGYYFLTQVQNYQTIDELQVERSYLENDVLSQGPGPLECLTPFIPSYQHNASYNTYSPPPMA
jgi:hypothetical protein